MKLRPIHCLLILAPAAALVAQEEEEVLPSGFPVNRYVSIWENSPFNREVVAAAATTIESSFAQSLVLEGVINDDEKGPVAYVRDVREDQSIVVTTAKNENHPYTIVSANQSRKPEETKVTVTDGNETGEIGFAAATLTQAIAQPVAAPPSRNPQTPPNRAGGGNVPPIQPQGGGGGGGQAGGIRPPGSTPQITDPAVTGTPTSVTPALDALDSEPRRRRVPLPGN